MAKKKQVVRKAKKAEMSDQDRYSAVLSGGTASGIRKMKEYGKIAKRQQAERDQLKMSSDAANAISGALKPKEGGPKASGFGHEDINMEAKPTPEGIMKPRKYQPKGRAVGAAIRSASLSSSAGTAKKRKTAKRR